MHKRNTIVLDRKELYGKEIAACQNDFRYFCEKYLKIIDRDGNVVSLILKPAQAQLVAEIEKSPWQIILKARQLGSSTVIAAYYFWKTLFTANERTLVVAHTKDAVKNIFRIYQNFYNMLPDFLKFRTKASSANEIVFFHGGTIRVATASSQNARGSTYTNIHCSEVAFWKDMPTSIAAIFQTASGNSYIILETTANGINEFFQMWSDEEGGFTKTFLSWTDEPDYIRRYQKFAPTDQLRQYAKTHGLSKEQLYWAAETLSIRCANNWHTFLQEYAIDPITCFISSGTKFFNKSFPHAQFVDGYKEYGEFNKYKAYVMGVDTASGSPTGDYSAFCVLDVTDVTNVKIASTYLKRITPGQFSKRVFEEYKKWNCTVVVESNTYGLSIIENLRTFGCSRLFRKVRHDKITNKYTEILGFSTNASTRPVLLSKLQQFLNGNWLDIICERLKFQMNTFIYDAKGKPDHSPGSHDDLIIATGLALQGIEQASLEISYQQRAEPRNMRERLEIELATGLTMDQLVTKGHFEREVVDNSITRVPYGDS